MPLCRRTARISAPPSVPAGCRRTRASWRACSSPAAASTGGDRRALGQDEPFAPLFAASALFAAAQAGDESQTGSLTAFERLCDDTLTAYFAKARTVVFGEQVVIAYLCALETEIAAARMIVNGLQIGLPADTIRTRLRELYF